MSPAPEALRLIFMLEGAASLARRESWSLEKLVETVDLLTSRYRDQSGLGHHGEARREAQDAERTAFRVGVMRACDGLTPTREGLER